VELPLPPHWDRGRVDEVWRVPYEERATEAAQWAGAHMIGPARDDTRRICLLLVDVQNTFCTPGFELFVPGAPDDNRRLCEFVYRNLGAITQIMVTLDTHRAQQIFHAAWLVDTDGRHPPPYTVVTVEDVERGVWRAADPALQEHLVRYVLTLEAGGRYRLTVWPYHAMLGGVGHALVSAVEEAVFFHGIAREVQAALEIKGDDALTEHYSALRPEIGGERNDALLGQLGSFDAVVVAGQAKSHCVAWTMEDLLGDAHIRPERVYLLEDCTSPVVVPDVVDFTEEGDAAFARFADAGAHVVVSSEPLERWPGWSDPGRSTGPARDGRSSGSGDRPSRSGGRR
jgi:nicotinamidase-related amidase